MTDILTSHPIAQRIELPGLPSSPIDNVDPTKDHTLAVFSNLGIGLVGFILILIIYDVLRHFMPEHVYSRSIAARNPVNNSYDGKPIASPPRPAPFPLSWVYTTFCYSEESLVKTHGLDVAMYLRFLSTQAKISLLLSLLVTITLSPVYFTAASPDLDKNTPGVQGPSGIEKFSLANVSPYSPRLWAALIAEIAVVAVILTYLYRDMRVYTYYRRGYRADNTSKPNNFALLIMDIPPDDRDDKIIFRKFDDIFPGSVVAVHPIRDAKHIYSLKTSYAAAVNKQVRTVHSAVTSRFSTPFERLPTSSLPSSSYPTTGIVTSPTRPPFSSSHTISRRRQRHGEATGTMEHSMPPLVSSFLDSSAQVSNDRSAFEATPTTHTMNSQVHSNNDLVGAGENRNDIMSGSDADPASEQSFVGLSPSNSLNAISSDDVSHYSPSRNHAPSQRSDPISRNDDNGMEDDRRQEHKARDLVIEAERNIDLNAPMTHAAFVVFRSKVAVTCAVSTPVFPNAGTYKVSRAPEPRAINWNKIRKSSGTRRLQQNFTVFMLIVMTALWIVPSSFIQLLRNFEQLGETPEYRLPWIKKLVEENPSLVRFLEGILPPFLLFLVLLIVPAIIRFIVSFERIPDNVLLEARVRNFLFFFYVMSIFVYQAGLGSLVAVLPILKESQRLLMSFLSVNVPSQATFFMTYVVMNVFFGSALGLVNIGRLLIRPFMRWRARTDQDFVRADRLFTDYPFTKMYALCMVLSLISNVYSTITPMINLVAFLYFVIAYLCAKQFLLYSHISKVEGGGQLFRGAWTGVLIGLYLHQGAMIGIFILKRAALQGILTSLSLLFSVWFTMYCRRTFLQQVENGTLLEQTNDVIETVNGEGGVGHDIPPNFPDMYIHPGLKPMEVFCDSIVDPVTAPMPKTGRDVSLLV